MEIGHRTNLIYADARYSNILLASPSFPFRICFTIFSVAKYESRNTGSSDSELFFYFLGRGDGSLARLRKVRRLLCPLQLRPLVGRREQPQGHQRGSHRQTSSSNKGDHPSPALCVAGRVGNKKPTQKNPPKKPPLKMDFLGFFKFLNFYENYTNLSL